MLGVLEEEHWADCLAETMVELIKLAEKIAEMKANHFYRRME